jgi:glycerophosphoryl diester phosphodiesterase
VVEKTLEETQRLDAGSWKDPKFKGEQVPKVEDIGNTCRDKAVMMLDLKCEGLGESLGALKQKLNFPSDQWILAPWVDAEGAKLRHYLPDVPMIRLTSKVPTDNYDDAYFSKMRTVGFSGYSVQWQNLPQSFIDAAHRNNFKIYCWTINDAPDLAGAVLAGVDGIITDDPQTTMKLVGELTAAPK